MSGRGIPVIAGAGSNLRPSGYEPDELPGCSTPRRTRQSSNGVVNPKLRWRRWPRAGAAPETSRPPAAGPAGAQHAEAVDLELDLVARLELRPSLIIEPPLQVPEPRSQPGSRCSAWEAQATSSSSPQIASALVVSQRVSPLRRACMRRPPRQWSSSAVAMRGPPEQAKCFPLQGPSLPPSRAAGCPARSSR